MGRAQCKTVVVGTVYPGVEHYLTDYENSLRDQTCGDFDLLVANDGFSGVDDRLGCVGASCRVIDVSGSIASIRLALISQAVADGYEKIVFTDCDDSFAKDRVEIVGEILASYPAVVNDLDLTDVEGNKIHSKFFAARFGEGSLFDEKSIRGGNILGLSNTAARSELLSAALELNGRDPAAFDWYLWANLLREGSEAIFTSKTTTRYRIHDNNVAGLPQPLNERNIRRGIEVKYRHYELMRKVLPHYEDMYLEFDGLRIRWKDDVWRKRYISALQSNALDVHMWWENVRGPTEVGLA